MSDMTITFTDGTNEILPMPDDTEAFSEIWDTLEDELGNGFKAPWLRVNDANEAAYWFRTETIRSIAV